MEYILFVLLLILATAIYSLQISVKIYWAMLILTMVFCVASRVCRIAKKFEAFKFFYNWYVRGVIIIIPSTFILLLVHWIFPWVLEMWNVTKIVARTTELAAIFFMNLQKIKNLKFFVSSFLYKKVYYLLVNYNCLNINKKWHFCIL